eukprot:scaffold7400_cov155-Ochromonas_danica.AAC.2
MSCIPAGKAQQRLSSSEAQVKDDMRRTVVTGEEGREVEIGREESLASVECAAVVVLSTLCS